jgi:hypothetical protein
MFFVVLLNFFRFNGIAASIPSEAAQLQKSCSVAPTLSLRLTVHLPGSPRLGGIGQDRLHYSVTSSQEEALEQQR